jgi:hypothetical protein
VRDPPEAPEGFSNFIEGTEFAVDVGIRLILPTPEILADAAQH